MERSDAYKIADAVLSGRAVPAAPAIPAELDQNKREMKHCEWCPRVFSRPIGSKDKHCGPCNSRLPKPLCTVTNSPGEPARGIPRGPERTVFAGQAERAVRAHLPRRTVAVPRVGSSPMIPGRIVSFPIFSRT